MDAVATQDTITQLISAIRRVGRLVPGAAEAITAVCTGHDYSRAGKPRIDWAEPDAKGALGSALVNDANALLAVFAEVDQDEGEESARAALANSDPAVAEKFLAAEYEAREWFGDSAYGTGDLRGAINDADHDAVIKPKPLQAPVEGGGSSPRSPAAAADASNSATAARTRTTRGSPAAPLGSICVTSSAAASPARQESGF